MANESMEKIASNAEDVYIHKYVERSPTDILMALHSTIRDQPGQPPYSMIDDPYLLSMRHFSRISCRLSMESGRAAARWVRDSNPELFQHRVADPFCQLFVPRLKLTADSSVDLNSLTTLIQQMCVSEAVAAYRQLCQQNVEVPQPVLHALLDVLCFFNAEDEIPAENVFERSFTADNPVSKWSDNGVAEEVFGAIKPPTARAYNTLIKGMLKHNQIQRANMLLSEMRNAGLAPDQDTLHLLIEHSLHALRRQSFQESWSSLLSLLAEMKSLHMTPTLATLNGALKALSGAAAGVEQRAAALALWREMTRAGVTPSLGSYGLLIEIFHERNRDRCDLIASVLRRLEGGTFVARHVEDLRFFRTAMRYINRDLHDPELALRLDCVLNDGDNRALLSVKSHSDGYYRCLLALLARTLTPTQFMEQHYRRIVPFVYSLEPQMMQTVLETLSVSRDADRFLPELWSDCVRQDLVKHTVVVRQMLRCLLEAVVAASQPAMSQESSVSDPLPTTLHSQLIDVGWNIFEINQLDVDRPEHMRFAWTGSMLDNILHLQCLGNHMDRACQIFSFLQEREGGIVGVVGPVALQAFYNLAVDKEQLDAAVDCTLFSSHCGLSGTKAMADKLLASDKLTQLQRQLLEEEGFC